MNVYLDNGVKKARILLDIFLILSENLQQYKSGFSLIEEWQSNALHHR